MSRRRTALVLLIGMVSLGAVTPSGSPARASIEPSARVGPSSPIKHVVVIVQENHSFDEVLGALCLSQRMPNGSARCSALATGKLPNGSSIPLTQEPDIVPNVEHDGRGQIAAINGGLMNNFPAIPGCGPPSYACYRRFFPSQIPSLASLARRFVISDRTFELSRVPSWHAHMELASGRLDGFTQNPGINPFPGTDGGGIGWGCNSRKDAWWWSPTLKKNIAVPSCIPKKDGTGPYRHSPVPWVPTIMDRMSGAGRSWKIYSGNNQLSYIWGICPTFADCVDTSQLTHMAVDSTIFRDLTAGTLPALSYVIPTADDSQHNGESMLRGDNWIARVVNAIGRSTAWRSTAIFITYDDCGCFYDHVPPPYGRGIRVPMVIVSPYARAGYTDHHNASFASILAFTEHLYGLTPLGPNDANAYDYADSFNFSQTPLPLTTLTQTPIPAWETRWIRMHPPDSDDPT